MVKKATNLFVFLILLVVVLAIFFSPAIAREILNPQFRFWGVP